MANFNASAVRQFFSFDTPEDRIPEGTRSLVSIAFLQYLCLLVYGIILFLKLARIRGGFFLEEYYLVYPVLLFLGAAFTALPKERFSRLTIFGLVYGFWTMGICLLHHFLDTSTVYIPGVIAPSLLALPFASLASKSVREKGLITIAAVFIIAALYDVICSGLLYIGHLPKFVYVFYFGDKYMRLQAFYNPNTAALIMMIGLVCWLSLGIGAKSRNVYAKIIRALTVVLLFCVLSLTNARTIILMTAAMAAGWIFLAIYRRNNKRIFLGVLAAGLAMIYITLLSLLLFRLHCLFLTLQRNGTAEDVVNLRSFANDLRTLTGRIEIWTSCLAGLKSNPALLLIGTEKIRDLIHQQSGIIANHAHNSYLQVLLQLGIPGLVLALIISFYALRDSLYLLRFSQDSTRRGLSLLCLAIMACGIMEPLLFANLSPAQFSSFFWFFLLGYLDMWYREEHSP